MALIIRLRQQGKRNRRSFRLVVTDRREKRDGKYIENLGWYDPYMEGEKALSVKAERIAYWLEKGALISEKVKSLVRQQAPEMIQKYTQKKMCSKKKKSHE